MKEIEQGRIEQMSVGPRKLPSVGKTPKRMLEK
jgi:hypothetical protein